MKRDYVNFECVHIADTDMNDSDEMQAIAYADIDGYTSDENDEGIVICRVWLLNHTIEKDRLPHLMDWHFLVDWHHNGYRNNECVRKLIDKAKKDLKEHISKREEQIIQKAYEKYKLKWMLDHGHTLNDLVHELQSCMDDGAESVTEAFDQMQTGTGFGGELWVCENEFREIEARDEAWMAELLDGEDYAIWETYIQHLKKS